MKIAPEVSYRGVQKTAALEQLIEEKMAKLDQMCDRINSCRIAVEKAHDHPEEGSPYRVRIDITVPEDREIAVDKSPDQGKQYAPVDAVIRDAFDAALRQLKALNDQQKQSVNRHEPGLREVLVNEDRLDNEASVPPAAEAPAADVLSESR